MKNYWSLVQLLIILLSCFTLFVNNKGAISDITFIGLQLFCLLVFILANKYKRQL